MATIRLDGTGNYTSVTAACAAEAIGATLLITQPGEYANETPVTKTGQQIINASGGTAIVSDVAARATHMFPTFKANVLFQGFTIRTSSTTFAKVIYYDSAAAGSQYWVYATDMTFECTRTSGNSAWLQEGGGSSFNLTRCTFLQSGGGTSTLLTNAGTALASGLTATECDFRALTTTPDCMPGVCTFTRCKFSTCAGWSICNGGVCTVRFDDCECNGAGTGLVIGYTGYHTVATINQCWSRNATGMLANIVAGSTMDSLTIVGSYAPTLVAKVGTLTAFGAASRDNRYNSTAAGTTTSSDAAGITLALAKIGADGVPLADSPLVGKVAPTGTPPAHATATDLNGYVRDPHYYTDVGAAQLRRWNSRDRRFSRGATSALYLPQTRDVRAA